MDAYERLSNTTDARGRKLEIFKLPRPPPLFRTYKEASGFKVYLSAMCSWAPVLLVGTVVFKSCSQNISGVIS